MGLLYYLPVALLAANLNKPRASGGASITVDNGPGLGSTWPQTVTILRAGVVLTVITITARTANVLTFGVVAEGYTDAALLPGDVLLVEPATPSAVNPRALALFGAIGSGQLALPTLADAAAPLGSLYYGSDHLDSATVAVAKLCRKDAAGNVTAIG